MSPTVACLVSPRWITITLSMYRNVFLSPLFPVTSIPAPVTLNIVHSLSKQHVVLPPLGSIGPCLVTAVTHLRFVRSVLEFMKYWCVRRFCSGAVVRYSFCHPEDVNTRHTHTLEPHLRRPENLFEFIVFILQCVCVPRLYSSDAKLPFPFFSSPWSQASKRKYVLGLSLLFTLHVLSFFSSLETHETRFTSLSLQNSETHTRTRTHNVRKIPNTAGIPDTCITSYVNRNYAKKYATTPRKRRTYVSPNTPGRKHFLPLLQKNLLYMAMLLLLLLLLKPPRKHVERGAQRKLSCCPVCPSART